MPGKFWVVKKCVADCPAIVAATVTCAHLRRARPNDFDNVVD